MSKEELVTVADKAGRWIVGLLVGLSVFFLQAIYSDIQDVKKQTATLNIDVAVNKSELASLREAVTELRNKVERVKGK